MKKSETRVFDATDENFQVVNDFIAGFLPEETSFAVENQLNLAVEEIYINIAHYAYAPKVGSVEIFCSLELSDESDLPLITVIFKDSGRPFNPLLREDPDITLSAEQRNIGGLGIYLTKQFMDSVEYEFTKGNNILTIKKKIR